MTESKHPVKRRISISIGFLVISLVFLGIWLWIRGKENANELIFLANIILPFLIGLGFLFVIIQLLVLDRFYYIKLTEESMVIYSVFPVKSFNYQNIKLISFNNGWLKGVDTDLYLPWFTVMKMKNPDLFLSDLKSRYKKATGKNLILKERML